MKNKIVGAASRYWNKGVSAFEWAQDKIGVGTRKKAQKIITNSLIRLKEGNIRFVTGSLEHINQDPQTIMELSEGQSPDVIVVCCSDSRVPPEIVFDQGLGEIFTIRTAGNVMGDYELGSVEYAVKHSQSRLILVMGHTGCGAIKAMLMHHDDELGEIPGHIASIVETLSSELGEIDAIKQGADKREYNAVMANVVHGVRQLRESDPILKQKYEKGKISILGAIYEIENGRVDFLSI